MSQAILLFDGDCGFCRRWILKWEKMTGLAVRYEPYQKEIKNYPQLTEENCKKSVWLILNNGTVFSGAHAVFKALALGGKKNWLWAYENLPLFAPITEFFYRLVARNRTFFSRFV